jgi:SAM-dependent methyltransferase
VNTNPFNQLTHVYEAMIDWPKRLAAEGPFYRHWFQQAGVKRVVDAACGTGRHAAMFHDWGLDVEGADLSPAMIQRARAAFGEPPGLRWAVRGFDDPVPGAGSWDAVVCVGNSLALAPDMATVRTAIARMMEALRPGGVLLVQVLNLWRLPDGPCVWQKCLRTRLPQGEALILKGVHRCGVRGHVELVVADPDGGTLLAHESPQFLGLESGDLEDMARQAGAAEVRFFGGHATQPYDRQASVDLVLAAT